MSKDHTSSRRRSRSMDTSHSSAKVRRRTQDGFVIPDSEGTNASSIQSHETGLPQMLTTAGGDAQTLSHGHAQQLPTSKRAESCSLPTRSQPQIQQPPKAEFTVPPPMNGPGLHERIIEASKRSRMLYDQWGQIYSESEKYEDFCLGRLDRILEEARSYEAHLLQQKEVLRGRLQALSRTLSLQ